MNSNTKLYSILSYITWIGWLISYFARDKEDQTVKFHVNQALVLNIASTIISVVSRIGGVIGYVCGACSIVLLVFWVMGIIRAAKLSTEPLPVIGGISIIK
jgi:uncharacterized membrane protein